MFVCVFPVPFPYFFPFLDGGFVSDKAVVTTMMMSFSALASISITWSLIGYSLAFGPGNGDSAPFIGNTHFGFFDSRDRIRDGMPIVNGTPAAVPEHAFMMFQLMFAIITAAVISGSVAGRMKLWAWLVFSTVWNFLVYIPLARWVFYSGGWLNQWGVLDFAGGIPVETASGVSSLVLAYWLDRWKLIKRHHRHNNNTDGQQGSINVTGTENNSRRALLTSHDTVYDTSFDPSLNLTNDSSTVDNNFPQDEQGHSLKPHNVPFILMGAGLLFFGWFGFNAGSAIGSGYLSSRAFANTHLAAAAAMVGWAASEMIWNSKREPHPVTRKERFIWGTPTAVGCATGVVVGLVAITPACGFVSQMVAILIGFTASPICYWAHRLITKVGIDDTLGCFPGHGVAGMFGIIMTGLFASIDEDSPSDGLVYGNPSLLGKQLVGLLVGIGVCIVGTTISYGITVGIGYIFHSSLLIPVTQSTNIDLHLLGEQAYVYVDEENHIVKPSSSKVVDTNHTRSILTAILTSLQQSHSSIDSNQINALLRTLQNYNPDLTTVHP